VSPSVRTPSSALTRAKCPTYCHAQPQTSHGSSVPRLGAHRSSEALAMFPFLPTPPAHAHAQIARQKSGRGVGGGGQGRVEEASCLGQADGGQAQRRDAGVG
jgi:hypothetical protein